MRTLFLSLLCLFGALTILQAQDSSYGVAYQAVARDADGDPLADTELAVRVTLKDGATTVWQEEHASVLTNQFGNLALTIGSGVTSAGTSLADVDWSAAGLHFEIEVDAGTGTYASFGDVAVQAVPVAMYALNGQEEEIAALWNALGEHEGDFNAFVTATNTTLSDLQGQITDNADQGAALLGMIEDAEGDISLLQIAVDQNTADLADIFANMTVNADGSMTFNDIDVQDLTVNGQLDIPGAFSAATGLFNYLSAGNADFEEALIQNLDAENLTFINAHGVGPMSTLELDGSLTVDGASTFNGAVSVPTPTADSDAATKGYVDAGDSAEATARQNADTQLQSNIDAEALARANADTQLQSNIDAEATARGNADTQLQSNIDAEATTRGNADTQLQVNIDAEATTRASADTNLQGQITSNDGDIDQLNLDLAAEATTRGNADTQLQSNIDQLQSNIDAEATARANADTLLQTNIDNEASARSSADEALQSDIDDNGYRIANAAAASGFVSGELNGVSGVPTHPGYSGTANLDGESSLVDADVALDDAIADEVSRAQGAEANIQGQVTTNANNLASEITRATNRENQIESEAVTARGIIASNLAQEILDREADVNTEESRAMLAEGALETAINNEVSRATDAEDLLETAINNEVTRATGAEADLQTAINNEVTRATNAEQAIASDLQQEIDDRIEDVNTEETRAIAAEGVLQDNIDAEEFRAIGVESALQSELDATQGGAGLNADGTYTTPSFAQGALYTVGATSLRNADLNLDEGLQAEKNARQNADDAIEDALADEVAQLQDQISGNDTDIETLQGAVDALNLVAPDGPEWPEILETAQYFEASGSSVELEAPYTSFQASNIISNTAGFQTIQTQVLTVDNAATVQDLTVENNMISPDGTIDIFDATQVDVYGTLEVDGVTTLNDDLGVGGNTTMSGTLNVAGETTLGDNTSINGDLDVTGAGSIGGDLDVTGAGSIGGNSSVGGDLSVTGSGSFGGTVTAADATELTHLASFGQLNTAADTLQQNIDDEVLRATTREGELQDELNATQAGAGLAADGSYNANSGTNYIDAATSLDHADDILDGALKTEESARIGADIAISDSLQQNIVDEMNRAIAREGELQEDINAEAIARINADNTISDSLQQNIDDEASRAMTAEDLLDARADSLAAAVSSNDGDIQTLQQGLADEIIDRQDADVTISDSLQANINDETTRAMIAEGLLNGRADSLAAAVQGNDGDILALQQDLQQEVTDRTNADQTISDSLQQNIVDEMNRAMTREGELQTELDATQTGAGLATDGSYNANVGTSYMDGATSLDDADDLLDTALKAEETRAITREDSIIDVLYWNKSTFGIAVEEEQVTLDPSITRVNNLEVDYRVRSLFAANNISADQGTFDVLDADEAEIDELTTFEIFNYGRITTDELHWTSGRAVGANSTTWLEGTLDVDGVTTLNDSLDVDGNAVFHSNVQIDNNLNVDGITTVDSLNAADGVYFESTLEVDGQADFNDDVNVDLDLDVDGITTVDSLNASLGVDFDSTLHVDGNTDVDGDFDVDGITTVDSLNASLGVDFDSTLHVDGNTDVDGDFDVDGITTVDSLNASLGVDFDSTLHVDGNTDVDGDFDVDGITTVDSLNAANGVDFDSTLNVDGAATMKSTLDVDGTAMLNDSLDVDGNAVFHSDVQMDQNLNVTGDITVDDVTGDTLDFNYAMLDKIATDTIVNISNDGLVILSDDDIQLLSDSIAADFEDLYLTGRIEGDATGKVALEMESSSGSPENEYDARLFVENDFSYSGIEMSVEENEDDADIDIAAVATKNEIEYGKALVYAESEGDHADVGMQLFARNFDLNNYSNGEFQIDIDSDDGFGEAFLEMRDDSDVVAGFRFERGDWDDAYDLTMGTESGDAYISAGNSLELGGIAVASISGDDDYITLGDTVNQFAYLNDDGEDFLHIYGDYNVVIEADGVAGLELAYEEGAALLYGDSVLIDGRFVVRDDADFYSSVHIDGDFDVDGITTVDSLNASLGVDFDSTLHVDGNTDVDGDFDVDGITTLDSLNASLGVDFDSTLHVDGNTDVDGDFDVDGITTLDSLNASLGVDFDSTLHVDGNTDVDGDFDVDGITTVDSLNASLGVDFDSTLHVDGNTDVDGDFDVDGITTLDSLNASLGVHLDSTLNVDGVTTLDSLNAAEGVYFESTLEVDGAADLNSTLTVDDFAQFNDTVSVAKHLVVETPTLPTGTSAGIVDEPEFAVKNAVGDYIVQVDGHNDIMTVQNLTVTDQAYWTGNMEVTGDISGDNIISTSGMFAGNTNYGYNWPSDDTDYNMLTRRDYVDYHRINQTDVPQFWSYDADLIAAASADPDYNEAVYYMNGNVVLYADSAATTGDNYVFTIKGRNFDQFRDADGSLTNDADIEASLWAENNEFSLNTNITRVDATTMTFTLGYDDVNSIVACTDGVVRPKLAVGTVDGGMFDTGIYLFLDIVAGTVIDSF